MRGHLDSRMRPILPLQVNGVTLNFLTDTGFTETLAIGLDVANMLCITQSRKVFYSQTAGGFAPFRTGICILNWFNGRIPVTVMVWQTPQVGPVDGLIGVGLLIGFILVADFNEGVLEIKDPALLLNTVTGL